MVTSWMPGFSDYLFSASFSMLFAIDSKAFRNFQAKKKIKANTIK
ncbi:MAG: hypothetical protein ACM3P0_02535 [Acidobacteriota bacterium]